MGKEKPLKMTVSKRRKLSSKYIIFNNRGFQRGENRQIRFLPMYRVIVVGVLIRPYYCRFVILGNLAF